MDHSTDLDKIIIKAESLVSDQLEATGFIGVVREGNGQSDRQRQDRMPNREGNGPQRENDRSGRAMNTGSQRMGDRSYSGSFNGVCWNCNQTGHIRRFCPGQRQSNERQMRQEPMYGTGMDRNGYEGPYHQPPPPIRPPYQRPPPNRENIGLVPPNSPMAGQFLTASPNQVQSHTTNSTDTQPLNLETPL